MHKGAWFSNLVNRELKADAALQGHRLGIETLCFSPDSRHIVSGSHDHTIKLWDAEKGACVRTATPLGLGVWGLDQDARGCVVSTGPDGCVALTDFRSPAAAAPPRKLLEKGFFVHALRAASRFLVGGNDRLLMLDAGLAPVATHEAPDTVFLSGESHGAELLASTSRGQLARFDSELRPGGAATLAERELRAFALVDERLFCSPDVGVLAEFALAPQPAPYRRFLAHSDRVNCLDASAASRLLVTGSKDSTTLVWHLDDLSFQCALVGSRDQVTCVRASPDGRLLALSTWDPRVYIYRAQSIASFSA